MDVVVRYFDGCPNWRLAEERLREALRAAGRPDHAITLESVETPEQAAEAGFQGSPTILIDGHDPFADGERPVGLSCRIYHTEAGPEGAPSIAQLAVALGA